MNEQMQRGGTAPTEGEMMPPEGDRIAVFFEAMTTAIGVETVFGEPVQAGDRVIIPVAETGMAGGLGFGQGPAGDGEQARQQPRTLALGGGAGGGASTRPVAAIIVTPNDVLVRPIVDVGKLALNGIATSAGLWKGAIEFVRALRHGRR
ncbi:MAG: GerW family sporulation protein [Anaerolineae bacterium]